MRKDKTSTDIIHDFCHSVKGDTEKIPHIFVYFLCDGIGRALLDLFSAVAAKTARRLRPAKSAATTGVIWLGAADAGGSPFCRHVCLPSNRPDV